MSKEEYSDNCPGCQPAVLDVETGETLPDSHPMMQAVMEVWKTTTLEQRKAYHAVMCNNSREPEHRRIVHELMAQMTEKARRVGLH